MGLTIIQTLLYAIGIYKWIVIAAIVFSWLYAFNVINSRNQFVGMIGNALYQMTEPLLRPIRKALGNILPNMGGLDISPIILFVILFFIESLIINVLAPAII